MGVKSAIISAVDLIKGVGFCAKSRVIDVEGATGTYHTNYEGKAQAAIEAFRDGCDFIYVHVEGPDECGHRGEHEVKTKAIEKIDSLILRPVYEYLRDSGEPFKILVLPDHPTPCEIRTHSSDPVPFFLYDSEAEVKGAVRYTEDECGAMNDYISDGSTLLDAMIGR